MGRFQDKVVIVTGASSGIGEATALDFAKEGAKLFITGRNEERLSNVAQKCKNAGSQVHQFIVELGDFKNLKILIDEAVSKYGGIDVLINNAGFGSPKPIEQVELDFYENLFSINLRAPVFLCKYALPYLKKSKGCIVNVSSCAALIARPGSVIYSMTKAALDHFTRGFSAECAPFGVRVNCVNPAIVRTGIVDNAAEDCREALRQRLRKMEDNQPFGIISSQQVSEGILYLCSSEMTTGISLPIDGGFLYNSKVK